MVSITPADLWDFAKQIASVKGSDWETALDPIGLLHDANFGRYDLTPINSVFFATTGGNGTHFVLMDAPGSPVVMVAPMAFDRPHTVVGRDLREFLSLGCKCGYFGLEQLVYDWIGTINWIKDPIASTQGSAEADLLDALCQHFSLQPIADPETRLKELRREHRDRIILSDDSSYESDD